MSARRKWKKIFERLELYLPKNVRRKTSTQANAPALNAEFITLHSVISSFKNPAKPSAEEKKSALDFEPLKFSNPIPAGSGKKTKRAVLKFLWQHAPTLALSENALRMQWERKYQRWIAANSAAAALTDRRPEVAAVAGFNVAPEDREKIIAHATFNTGGRVSQAWRELRDDDQLVPTCWDDFRPIPPASRMCRTAFVPLLATTWPLLEDIHHGPRQAKLNGAHISRTGRMCRRATGISPMTQLCLCIIFVPDGRGWFNFDARPIPADD